ncbi:MAG: hypothetical protein ACOYL3_16175 [Desulfuromonadaceae bacterium]
MKPTERRVTSYCLVLMVKKETYRTRQFTLCSEGLPERDTAQRTNSARLILADGTEYRGAVIEGTNRKGFKKNSNRLLLTFALDTGWSQDHKEPCL